MTHQVIIIDDEPPAREIIKAFLKPYEELEIAGIFEDGFSGLKAIRELQPDLVFLDIQMPRLTGFEVVELLENPPLIIFSTAYDQYAIKAFEMSAVDYLLKPYSRDRFDQAVKKALTRLQGDKEQGPRIQKLIETADERPELLNRIAVKVRHNVHVIPVSEIIWLEAEGDYVMIHTAEGRFLKEKTMKYFETHLDPDQFARIHRSAIVNVNQIARVELYDKEQYAVMLHDGTKLKASSTGYKTLKQILKM
jgi:two-component system, LytTR family, response regulator